ncbi:cytochrome c oxidase subunit II [Numidum massiliense]|uniref:cytochrome c oxidase subunit II n=1 Tax=Numidum massiliense TaxID=1522315 RepID=UPI0006D5AFEA|nr:cytochrome c oxidase subunit II [Numidum massiliense]
MNKNRRARYVLLMLAIMAFGLAGCTVPQSVFDPKGPMAQIPLDLLWMSVWVMTFVTVVVAVILVIVLIRFRTRKGEENVIPEQTEGSTKLELVWVVIPAVLLTILAIPTVKAAYEIAEVPQGSDVLHVKVTGKQYWWEFEYPELGIITANEMHIPAGEDVRVSLESTDVVHSFWVPKLAGKLDNIPGQTNYMKLHASEPGTYSGQCAELCGPSHALMAFQVVAHKPGDFDNWVEKMKNPETKPKTALAEDGEKIFAKSCASCHAIEGTDSKGRMGPDLTGFGNRKRLAAHIMDNNRENLIKWIQQPQKIKPGNKMPDTGMSDEQAEALAEYLEGLK